MAVRRGEKRAVTTANSEGAERREGRSIVMSSSRHIKRGNVEYSTENMINQRDLNMRRVGKRNL